jgi:hypothetical protein
MIKVSVLRSYSTESMKCIEKEKKSVSNLDVRPIEIKLI